MAGLPPAVTQWITLAMAVITFLAGGGALYVLLDTKISANREVIDRTGDRVRTVAEAVRTEARADDESLRTWARSELMDTEKDLTTQIHGLETRLLSIEQLAHATRASLEGNYNASLTARRELTDAIQALIGRVAKVEAECRPQPRRSAFITGGRI